MRLLLLLMALTALVSTIGVLTVAAEESMQTSIADRRPAFSRPFSTAAFPVIDAWLDGVS